ncbi:MAG: hypothetical protein ABIR32_21450 [Ilumatobacteraceae bacterium]
MSAEPSARFVVVPTAPGGALTPFVQDRQRDDVDGLFDDLLGEDTTDGPGVADLLLFTAGVVAVVWGTWISTTSVVVVGAIVGLLGVVLPLRSLGRRMRARRSTAALAFARTTSGLLVLDAGPTARLAMGYGRLLDSTTPSNTGAREAALAALREVASLLDGRPPNGLAEVEYIDARSAALERLADAMASRAPVDETRAVIEARNELDAISGSGSLAQIDAVLNRHVDE